MAEEQTESPQPAGAKRLVRLLLVFAGVIVAAVAVALVTFQFVLRPRLAGGNDAPPEGGADRIPATRVAVDFPQSQVAVIMPPDANLPASLLVFEVTLECNNPQTAALIDAHRARFIDMLRKLHSNRRREELDDPLLEESIQRQALEQANQTLERLQERPNPEVRVTDVFHKQFLVVDQL
jgi:flagellar basal body-associated protein FliL